MIAQLNRRIIGLAVVAFAGCLIMSVYGAAQDGELSLGQVVRRLLALEDRVGKHGEQLGELGKQVAEIQRGLASAQQPQVKKPIIEIMSPTSGAEIGMEVIVEGIVRVDDLEGRWPVVAVHPMLTNLIWIQPLPVKPDPTREGYTFRCRAFCGTKGKGIGEKFELYALLPKKGELNEADVLEKLPKDIPVSMSVLLTRVKD